MVPKLGTSVAFLLLAVTFTGLVHKNLPSPHGLVAVVVFLSQAAMITGTWPVAYLSYKSFSACFESVDALAPIENKTLINASPVPMLGVQFWVLTLDPRGAPRSGECGQCLIVHALFMRGSRGGSHSFGFSMTYRSKRCRRLNAILPSTCAWANT